MFIQNSQHANLNAAIILYCDIRIPTERNQQIEARFGADIFTQVETIYNQAINCGLGPDWDMDAGLAGMHAFLTAHYPWLTQEAASKLNYHFILAWK